MAATPASRHMRRLCGMVTTRLRSSKGFQKASVTWTLVAGGKLSCDSTDMARARAQTAAPTSVNANGKWRSLIRVFIAGRVSF